MVIAPLPLRNDPTYHAPPSPCDLRGHDWRLVRDGIVGQECRCCGARRLLSHADG